MDCQSVLNELAAQEQGLSQAEATRCLTVFGPNRLRPPKKRGPLVRFVYQFHNVLIYVLLIAAAVTTALAHWVDTGVIVGVVVINALIGFIQEGKAERALDAIRHMLSQQAFVRRDGQYLLLLADELVPGDVVMLRAGDKVRLSVTDNGDGFPEELMARIFEPYVTTKPRGTGLGLAIVKKIVDEHHGSIAIENRPERGASGSVLLPRIAEAA